MDFFQRIALKTARWMQGRYGLDGLSNGLMALGIISMLLSVLPYLEGILMGRADKHGLGPVPHLFQELRPTTQRKRRVRARHGQAETRVRPCQEEVGQP